MDPRSKVTQHQRDIYHQSQCHSSAVARKHYTHLDVVSSSITAKDIYTQAVTSKSNSDIIFIYFTAYVTQLFSIIQLRLN